MYQALCALPFEGIRRLAIDVNAAMALETRDTLQVLCDALELNFEGITRECRERAEAEIDREADRS